MVDPRAEVKRMAEVIRTEADALQERLISDNNGRLPDVQPSNPTYRRAWIEAYRSAADLLDDGRGGQ